MSQPMQRDPRQPFGAPDPRAPLGAPPPPTVTIEQFQAPKNRGPLLLGVAAAVAIAALLAGFVLFRTPLAQRSPSPSASASPTSTRTFSPSTNGSPWELTDGSASGYWEILQERWEGDVVNLEVQVECDKGYLSWEFIAYPNQGSEALDAEPDGPAPYVAAASCRGGQKVRGWVSLKFPHGRGSGNLILATRLDAVSGLKIKG